LFGDAALHFMAFYMLLLGVIFGWSHHTSRAHLRMLQPALTRIDKSVTGFGRRFKPTLLLPWAC
jgi:hypothetical protein